MSSQLKPLSTARPRPPINNEPELGYRFDVVAALMARLLREIAGILSAKGPEGRDALENATAELALSPNGDGRIDFYEEIQSYEIELIKNALEQADGSQRRAAELLGLKVTTLNSKMKHLGIYTVGLIAEDSAKKDLPEKDRKVHAMDMPRPTSEGESPDRKQA